MSQGSPFGGGGLVPRTPNSGLTLGAAGGPRGFGAGVTQVLINLLLNYNAGALRQAAADLKKFQAEQLAAQEKLSKAVTDLTAKEKALGEARRAASVLTKEQLTTLEKIRLKNSEILSLAQKDKAAAAQAKAQRDEMVRNLAAAAGLTEKQVKSAIRLQQLTTQVANAERNAATAANEHAVAEARVTGALQAQQILSTRLQSAVSRVGALTLGLIGGTIGGALTSGLILGPLQGFIDKITQGLEELVDPAKAAGEALSGVADQIKEIADENAVTNLEAARRVLEGLDLPPELAGRLEGAVNLQELQKQSEERQKIIDLLRGQAELQGQLVITTAREKAQVDLLAGSYQQLGLFERFSTEQQALHNAQQDQVQQVLSNLIPGYQALSLALDGTPWAKYVAGAAEASGELQALGGTAADTAAYIANLNQELLSTQVSSFFDSQIEGAQQRLEFTIDAIRQRSERSIDAIRQKADNAADAVRGSADRRIEALQDRISSLDSGPSGRTKALQNRLDALKDAEPSRRTRELAAAIERLNRAQDEANYKSQLADIAQRRNLILLRERLRLTDQEIDIEKYQGQERLVAIAALQKQMQERNEAQDRFNRLLEIQFQINQGVRRQQGETIRDFIARRAQYYRGLLQQAAELTREGPQQELEAEKERVETSIELKELEEQRRKVIEDRARKERMDDLREQLQASQERDRKELESRRESLQKQLEASREADQAALQSARERLQDQIESIRKHTQERIEQINKARDADVNAAQAARDRNIDLARQVTDKLIDQLRTRADQAKQWTNYANIQSLNAAIAGAEDMATLQRLAGQMAGAAWTLAYLGQTGQWLTMDPNARAQLMQSWFSVVRTYSQKVNQFRQTAAPPKTPNLVNSGGPGGGYEEGGWFRAGNFNTPLRGDVRWGDGNGEEMGFIFNNKLMHAIRERSDSPLVGSVTFQSQDPYRDQARFERRIRNVVRDEMNN